MTIQTVLDKLIAFHPQVDAAHTCDTIKCGDPSQECTGIVITCFASVEVIRKAAELGANLIITHEPTFYGDAEGSAWMENDQVFTAKKQLLEESGIVIWRDHDHVHGDPPMVPVAQRKSTDMIYYGIMRELEWEDYLIGHQRKPLWFDLPKQTVGALAKELCDKLQLHGMRIVGSTDAEISRVFICEHVTGRHDDDIMRQAAEMNADVIIPLEIIDWTLSEYVRDSTQLGMPKAILEMGHFNFEEIGMKHMLRWLPDVIGTDIPMHYVQSGDSFNYYVN